MATPKTRHRIRLELLLADGNWHDRTQLVADTVAVIPPGVAARQAVANRAGARARWVPTSDRGPEGGAPPGDDVRVGANDITIRTLATMRRAGHLQERTVDGTAQIRLTPQGDG